MSKLYKELKYDTDRIMQPGDPLTSPDGNNRVQVNDNGTASIITGTQYEFTLTVPEIQGASFRVRIGKSNSTGDGYSKLILSITGIENAVADQYGGAGYSINGEYAGEIAALMTDASFADMGQPLPDSSKRIPIFGGFYVNFYVRSLGRTSSWCDWSNLSSATETDEQTISTSGHKHTASDINYGQLAVTYGGTGKASHTINSVLIGGTTTTSALQNVASAKGAFYSNGANIKPQFGTLGVDMGGTGTTSFPQNAIVTGNATSPGAGDLTSVSTAAGALYATGANSKATFGTLPASYGGTGVDGSSQSANKVLASPSSGTGAISFRALVAADIPDLSTSKLTTGTLGVARGGTGKISHTVNSVIIGGISATGALQNVTSAKGAFYSTGSNKKPTFGTLPVAQGGTGMTTTTNVNAVVIGNSSDAANAMQTVAAASGAFYATGANAKPQFGTLPVAQGGTGSTTTAAALTVLGAMPATANGDMIQTGGTYWDTAPIGVFADAITNTVHQKLSTEDVAESYDSTKTYHAGDYCIYDEFLYVCNSTTTGSWDSNAWDTSITIMSQLPKAATANPVMDGTAAVGTSAKFAKEDHVHPTDTSRAAASHTHSEYIPKCTNTTYANLVTFRTNSQLVPGAVYRITDYSTTTAQADTQSAGHAFDLLVVADDVNKLNENAHAIQHAGDTYFANCNLAAWKIKYSLDNSTAKFAWASSSGKGVIYEMEDEWGNKCGYDFKNIQFKRYAISAVTSTMISGDTLTSLQSTLVYSSNSNITMARSTTTTTTSGGVAVSNYYGLSVTVDPNTFNWAYTFENSSNSSKDMSLDGSANGNVISPYCTSSKYTLNNIVMRGNSISNVFDGNCRDMTFKSLANGNKFGYACYRLCLGGGASNTFGGSCHDMVISGASIIAMQHCTIGGGCHHITSGQRLLRNTIGPLCSNLSFSTFNLHNIIGTGCSNIHFGSSTGSKSYYQNITIEPNNQNIYLNCTGTTSSSAYYQNVTIGKGVNNTDTWKTITDANTNQKYETIYQAENSLVIPV